MIKNGFVLSPSKELIPDYKLSPFSTADVAVNRRLPDSDSIDIYFAERFKSKQICYTSSGREAINLALINYNLSPEDYVTILTTTGNRYVSGCVTREIDKFCKWSRKIETGTRLILVIHEFGIPFRNIGLLKQYNQPVIEDCAYSFFSGDKNDEIGNTGEFVIYSFPKMFPMQAGGMLVSNAGNIPDTAIDKSLLRYLKNSLSYHILKSEWIKETRVKNYNYLKKLFHNIGLEERFELGNRTVPGIFMFKAGEEKMDLPGLKKFLYENGIECSIFYGEESFFTPVHQNLLEDDMLYIFEAVKYYKSIQNDNI
jgi:hypothetical protein